VSKKATKHRKSDTAGCRWDVLPLAVLKNGG